jgi:hypothetical protein
MNKSITHSYKGMMQDISKSTFNNEYYFEGKNIRIVATDSQSTGNVTNEKGNELILTIPIPVIDYTNKEILYNTKSLPFTTSEISALANQQSQTQIIVGQCVTREYIILITTDDNGIDCVWKVDHDTYDITLLYLRNLELSTNNPVQILNNFENKSIDKIYWVDAKNQMRFLNIKHSILNQDLEELIDVPVTVVNMVGKYGLTQPYISQVISGGNHTAGMIQYAYNLYRLNSSQTKLSPISELISLDNDTLGGGDLNEIVSTLPIIRIDNIDTSYTNIRVYAIKYTSYNEIPTISLIEDRSIPSNNFIEVYDDGSAISTLSLEEFLFLGSDIMIPKHINTKDNRLFFANYNEINFKVDLDTRAYSFKDDSTSIVYDNIFLDGSGNIDWQDSRVITNTFTDDSEDTFDSINLDYDNYTFQFDGITYGGEGKYVKYELAQTTIYDVDARYYKDEEIYRLGIEFYNAYGQNTLPRWIADFKTKTGNLEGNYNILKFTLKPEFFIWLNTTTFTNDYDKPVGYRVLVAERTASDRTIVANGILGTMMINDKSSKDVRYSNPQDVLYVKDKAESLPKLPNFLLRNINETSLYGTTQPLRKADHLEEMSNKRESSNTEVCRAYYGDDDTSGRFYQYNLMQQIYSPEILFKDTVSLNAGMQLRVKGAYKNTYNANWAKTFAASGGELLDEGKGYNGILPAYSSNVKQIIGNPYRTLDYGIICHPGGSDANRVTHSQFYRGYGKVNITDDFIIKNNSVSLENDISIVSPTVDSDTRITQIANNKGIRIVTKSTLLADATVTYDITPTGPWASTPYTVQITSDDQGNNALVTHTAVTGNDTITATKTNTYTFPNIERTYTFFLLIDSVIGFECDIDLNTTLGITPPDYIEYESLSNHHIITADPSIYDTFEPRTTNITYDIYGIPEITEKGQSYTIYNNDSNFRYANTFTSILTDGDSSWDDDGRFGRRIVSANSDGNRCLTLVLGDDNPSTAPLTRPIIDSTFLSDNGLTGDNNGLIVEIIKSRNDIYLGNIYGGNSYEDKQRTNYIQIGDYTTFDISNPELIILSPGDTFVNYFRFARVVRKDEDVMQEGTVQFEEIVEYFTETTVDLKNRSDISLNDWDSKFNPLDNIYHKYNKVYSQLSNLIRRRNIDYNIKTINNFDTNIIASKLKSGGELIDNWTDIQPNEVITLDGKFGSINSLPDFNDELYVIQDTGFAFLSINPRVQVQGADGLALELGTGSVLQDYKYISTKSGTLNKWGVVSTTQGIYYFDLLNKSIQLFKGGILNLSNSGNLHTYFINNIDFNLLKLDNPILKRGVSSTYDFINKDILFSFHQNEKSFTISYNELTQSFISFYDYIPSFYISYADSLITTDVQNKKLFKHFIGDYNKFYNNYYSSSVTLNVNPEPNKDCVFDNINFKSDVTLNNVDQPDITLTHIQAYNDYQNSGLIPLTLGRNNNLRRKFRDWNASIPRQNRNRIRAPYIKLKLQFDNTNNYKLILHNLNVFYTTY